MIDEADNLHVCSGGHEFIARRGKHTDKKGIISFFRVCTLCAAIEIRRVEMWKDGEGNYKPKVVVYLGIAGRNITLPSQTYQLIHEEKGDLP